MHIGWFVSLTASQASSPPMLNWQMTYAVQKYIYTHICIDLLNVILSL